jgi:hypothetical protein
VAALTVAYAEAMSLAGVPWSNLPLCWAIAAIVEALVAAALRGSHSMPAKLWALPLTRGSYLGGVAAGMTAVGDLFLGWAALQSLATALMLIGTFLLIRGAVSHARLPLHAGLALLNGAYLCEIVFRHVSQLQAFALPLGLSLLLAAYLEWRRGAMTVKAVLEIGAIVVLLGTTLVQGFGGFGAGDGRFAYDTFLLLESAAVLGLGAVLHWKRLFFAACCGVVADVGILLTDPVRSMPAWYLMALIGFAMIGVVMVLEQRRQRIPLWIDEVRERLDAWD